MNRLTGTITEIQSHEGISLVKVKAGNVVFTSIVLDTPDTAAYLKTGNSVDVLFKETEVIISKDTNPFISIQNKIDCTILAVKTGMILCELDLFFEETTIKSIITANASKQLALKENDKVIALIKTNEVSLAPND